MATFKTNSLFSCVIFLFLSDFRYFCVLANTLKEAIYVRRNIGLQQKFVEDKGYEAYITNKYPDKKIAILSCMDTRLTALLPAALGIKNGDVKMIKMREASFPILSVV